MQVVWLQDFSEQFLSTFKNFCISIFDRNVFLTFPFIGYQKELDGVMLKSFFHQVLISI